MDRDQIVSLVTPLDGLRWPDHRYIDLLMPAEIESSATRQALAGQSSCALLARAVWRLAGCSHPILAAPYRIGRAVSDVVEIATDAGAWHEPGDGEMPGAGDVLLVGDPGHEHVAILVSVEATVGLGGWTVRSVDGGQGAHGAGIAARTRTWPGWSTRWLDVVDPTPWAPTMTRPVRGWADSMRVLAA